MPRTKINGHRPNLTMTNNKWQTRSSAKKNNKNNSPGRAHKRKQRCTKGDDQNNKEPSYSPNITIDDIAAGTSTATVVERTRCMKKLFKGKTTGLPPNDNKKSSGATLPTQTTTHHQNPTISPIPYNPKTYSLSPLLPLRTHLSISATSTKQQPSSLSMRTTILCIMMQTPPST
jgi:hypothetical protein